MASSGADVARKGTDGGLPVETGRSVLRDRSRRERLGRIRPTKGRVCQLPVAGALKRAGAGREGKAREEGDERGGRGKESKGIIRRARPFRTRLRLLHSLAHLLALLYSFGRCYCPAPAHFPSLSSSSRPRYPVYIEVPPAGGPPRASEQSILSVVPLSRPSLATEAFSHSRFSPFSFLCSFL
jgi:hypothetical protein